MEILDKLKGNTYWSRMMAPIMAATTTKKKEEIKAYAPANKDDACPFSRACENYGHQHCMTLQYHMNPQSVYYTKVCV
jgi:hypothetical protein